MDSKSSLLMMWRKGLMSWTINQVCSLLMMWRKVRLDVMDSKSGL